MTALVDRCRPVRPWRVYEGRKSTDHATKKAAYAQVKAQIAGAAVFYWEFGAWRLQKRIEARDP
jgi:hypothetical protein